MGDKWKHDNWHNNQANRQKCGKRELEACPYCRITELQQDVERLTAFYNNQGYIQAKVSDPTMEAREEWVEQQKEIERLRENWSIEVDQLSHELRESKGHLTRLLEQIEKAFDEGYEAAIGTRLTFEEAWARSKARKAIAEAKEDGDG